MPGTDLIVSEEAVLFGAGTSLVGIVTPPSTAPTLSTGVIFLNAGVVHRVGPGRLYVTLARRLSHCGFTALRFDHSGIGDSPSRDDHLNFDQSSVEETIDAMNWLAAEKQCGTFVLVGLCSGTLTAFRVAQVDSRVQRLVLLTALLLDPSTVPQEVVAEASERRIARSYLTEKAGSARAWRRLLSGAADLRRVWRAIQRVLPRPRPQRALSAADTELLAQLRRLLERGVAMQFIYAEPTTVLEWFRMTIAPALSMLQRAGGIEVHIVKHADHTFTQRRHQERVIELISGWLGRCT